VVIGFTVLIVSLAGRGGVIGRRRCRGSGAPPKCVGDLVELAPPRLMDPSMATLSGDGVSAEQGRRATASGASAAQGSIRPSFTGSYWSGPGNLGPENFQATLESEFRAFIYGPLLEML
jgi:hypothetical protein